MNYFIFLFLGMVLFSCSNNTVVNYKQVENDIVSNHE